jgi:hypothetical protein
MAAFCSAVRVETDVMPHHTIFDRLDLELLQRHERVIRFGNAIHSIVSCALGVAAMSNVSHRVTRKQAATILKCGYHNVLRLERSGALKSYKNKAGNFTLDRDEVLRFAAERSRRSDDAEGELQATVVEMLEAGATMAAIVKKTRKPVPKIRAIKAEIDQGFGLLSEQERLDLAERQTRQAREDRERAEDRYDQWHQRLVDQTTQVLTGRQSNVVSSTSPTTRETDDASTPTTSKPHARTVTAQRAPSVSASASIDPVAKAEASVASARGMNQRLERLDEELAEALAEMEREQREGCVPGSGGRSGSRTGDKK